MAEESEMEQDLRQRIIEHVSAGRYKPEKPRQIARAIGATDEDTYPVFRRTLRQMLDTGQLADGPKGTVVGAAAESRHQPARKPAQVDSADAPAAPAGDGKLPRDVVIGPYRQNKRGFGFVMPTNPPKHEDLYIAEEDNAGAISGDIVKAKITGRYRRGAETMFEGRIIEIVQRTRTHFVGTLEKRHGEWVVLPDGNDFTDPISTPDAGSRHIKPGTKVAVELTQYPKGEQRAVGVITEVLGQQGEKDVDLRGVIIQYNLPADFPEAVKQQARAALDRFNATLDEEKRRRMDLTQELIITIDPDDAKDFDDAISIRKLPEGNWQLGVHIADVAFFVEPGSALDEEAAKRGNSTYFPGFVIPMLPEVLSNGVCSLQEGVPRLCKSVFIELDEDGEPVGTKFADTIISSAKRLRYREAQAILDKKQTIPHPDGDRAIRDYPEDVVELLHEMDRLAKRIQKRRHDAGQLVLALPQVDLVLDEGGAVVGAVPEDESYTHTIIEMFMVEANEAVARLLNGLDVPFIRRVHPEPDPELSERLRNYVWTAGYKLPKTIDRKALQALLESVKGQPNAFAVNMAVLRSLTRAEYSPEPIGHYALASEQYCHFTSPIRRYADLTVHRQVEAYLIARDRYAKDRKKRAQHVQEESPSYDQLAELGKRISYTERRSADAENELRTVKLLELLSDRIGDEFHAVVTGVTKFGVFMQLKEYLIDGLVRYEDMPGDWWEVDERSGVVRGRNTGQRITIGDLATVRVARVDVPRRELDVSIQGLKGGGKAGKVAGEPPRGKGRGKRPSSGAVAGGRQRKPTSTGASRRNVRSKGRERRKR
jgi:ribonuclease R